MARQGIVPALFQSQHFARLEFYHSRICDVTDAPVVSHVSKLPCEDEYRSGITWI